MPSLAMIMKPEGEIMYEKLISFLPELEGGKVQSGLCHSDPEADGSEEHPYVLPFVVYGRVARELEEEIYRIVQDHPELNLNHYYDVLKERGVDWNGKEMEAADVSDWDGQGVLALMVGIIRAERFSDGTYKQFLENGCFVRWLHRLKEIEEGN